MPPEDIQPTLVESANQREPRRGIAPLWHTLLFAALIIAISSLGSNRVSAANRNPQRLLHYGLSALLELFLVGFVWIGLRLRRVPFRTLFGVVPRGLNNITKEAGIALLFWLVSMFVLASTALTWNAVQTAIYMRHTQNSSGPATKAPSPEQQQVEMLKKLMTLAPANGMEIAAWGALCLLVGFSEEVAFRGYLQQQGIAVLRNIPLGVALSAMIFGAAHGYQGIRGMCLIAIYGALFSAITLLRRGLFPGMLAHSWHDFATGLALSLIRESKLLDQLPHLH